MVSFRHPQLFDVLLPSVARITIQAEGVFICDLWLILFCFFLPFMSEFMKLELVWIGKSQIASCTITNVLELLFGGVYKQDLGDHAGPPRMRMCDDRKRAPYGRDDRI